MVMYSNTALTTMHLLLCIQLASASSCLELTLLLGTRMDARLSILANE